MEPQEHPVPIQPWEPQAQLWAPQAQLWEQQEARQVLQQLGKFKSKVYPKWDRLFIS